MTGDRTDAKGAGPGTPGTRALLVPLGAFGFFGLFWGAFAVLLADLSRALGLSPGPLGVALFVGAAASILTMALLGWMADRLGRCAFLMASGGVFGLGIVGLAAADGYVVLLMVMATLYPASGLYDVGINAAAVDLEQYANRRFMALLHATFSGGGVVGALSAGALLSAGLDYRYVYLLVLVPLAVVVIALAVVRLPPPTEEPEEGAKTGRFGLYRSLPLLLVAAIATLSLLSEGEMEHWSGIYLLQSLALPVLVGASGVAVFHASMAAGRLCAVPLMNRFSNRATLTGAGLLAAGGMAISLATLGARLVVAGSLVVGLALSAVVPIAFSIAGDMFLGRAGGAVSIVTALGYGGFLVGPVLVGGLAEVLGLRAALGTIVAAGLLISILLLRVRDKPAGEKQEAES